MIIRASVKDAIYNDAENNLRQNNFVEMISNIKGAIIKTNHNDYVEIKLDDDAKIKNIITESFDNRGWVKS